MKLATHSLADLFGVDVRYVIHLYQRPYVWKKETHWRPLWEDVEEVVGRQLDQAAEREARLLRRLTRNDEELTFGDGRFKVWPTNANQASFRPCATV